MALITKPREAVANLHLGYNFGKKNSFTLTHH